MRQQFARLVILIICFGLILLLTACGSFGRTTAPSADDVPETQIVKVVEVTRVVDVTRVIDVTATRASPTETATSKPTAKPTATPLRPTATPIIPTPPPLPTATRLPTQPPPPTATPVPTRPPLPSATPTPNYPAVVPKESTINVRSGPGTDFAAIGRLAPGQVRRITGKNTDGTWFEIEMPDVGKGWVAAGVVTTNMPPAGIPVAQVIPTAPPTPTSAPAAPTAPPAGMAGLGVRQTIGNWEIQPDRVHKEKTVYWYGDPYVAMGNYAIVILRVKNTGPGTDEMARTLAPYLRDDKGRRYEMSDPLTIEREAMLAAAWEFDVHPTVFSNVQPGTEPPLLMLWDVGEDVQNLRLYITNGRQTVSWDLGDFTNIPPFKK